MHSYPAAGPSGRMDLPIGRTLEGGIRRALTATGALLAVLMFAYVLAFVAAVNTLVASVLPGGGGGFGLTLPVSPLGAGLVALAGYVVGVAVTVVAARAFTRGPAERGSFDASLVTRRVGRATLSALGANLVVSVAVSLGFVLLVVPGLFLSVSFVFVVFAVAVEDRRAVPALRRSWALARGHRWRLLAIVIVVGVGTGGIASLGSLVSVADPALGQVVSLAVTAPLAVLSYGVLAEAYVRVRDAGAG